MTPKAGDKNKEMYRNSHIVHDIHGVEINGEMTYKGSRFIDDIFII